MPSAPLPGFSEEAGPGATLAAAMQASGHRLYELEIATGKLAWPACPLVGGILGHMPATIDSLDAWLQQVHPDDRAQARAAFLAASADVGPTPAWRYRVRDAAGEYRWLETRGSRCLDAGRVLQVGALHEVTEQRRVEQRLALCARILETIREAVLVTDRDGTILWANAAFGALVGVACERLAGRTVQAYSSVSETRRIEQLQEMRDAIARRGSWRGRVDVRRHDGRPLITEACVSLVEGEQGDLWVHVHRDVTERLEMEEASLAATRVEQQRLGLELHDSLGQELAGTSMLVRTLRNNVAAGACADPALLRDVETLLQSSVARCRDLAQAVSPFIIDENGLGAALQDLVQRARAASGVAAIRADVCARSARFDGNFGYHLFRLAQLALSAAVARAGVSSVVLQVWCEDDDRVVVAIVGDGDAAGSGAEPAELRLLRHRLALLGGSSEPLDAAGGRHGLIMMLPRTAAEPRARAPGSRERRALRA